MRTLALIILLGLPGLAQAHAIPANCQGALEFTNWRVAAGGGLVTVRNLVNQPVLLNARVTVQGTRQVSVNFMPTAAQQVGLGPVPAGTSPNRPSNGTSRECSAGISVNVFPGGPVN